MGRFTQTIERHAQGFNALHKSIHETARVRDDSSNAYKAWQDACDEFHAYRSPVTQWLEDCLTTDLCASPEARQFVIDYLAVDPMYFRSGYTKEKLLARIKRCDLNEREAKALRQILINTTRRGGRREYRRYCHLIPKIGTATLREDLEALASSDDGRVAARARFALGYF